MTLAELLDAICDLLIQGQRADHGRVDWLRQRRKELLSSDDPTTQRNVATQLQRAMGGMGSLSDISLESNALNTRYFSLLSDLDRQLSIVLGLPPVKGTQLPKRRTFREMMAERA